MDLALFGGITLLTLIRQMIFSLILIVIVLLFRIMLMPPSLILTAVMEKCIPCSTIFPKKNKPWLTKNLINKYFWKLLKFIDRSKPTIPTLSSDGITTDTDVSKAQLLSSQFCKSFNINIRPLTVQDVHSPPPDCPPDLLISEGEVYNYLVKFILTVQKLLDLTKFLAEC